MKEQSQQAQVDQQEPQQEPQEEIQEETQEEIQEEPQEEIQQQESSAEISTEDYKSLQQLLEFLETINDEQMAQEILEICKNKHPTKAAHQLSEDLSPELLQKLNSWQDSTKND